MNKPQEKIIAQVLKTIDVYNNEFDNDTLFESYQMLQNADTYNLVVYAIEYAIDCFIYMGSINVVLELKRQLKDLESYNSLLNATTNKNEEAIEWWVNQAKSGEVMRIM